MPPPDVRVRLSPEGEQQVIAAFRKIQAEGQRTAAMSSRGFGRFNNVLGSTRNLLAGLGVALGVQQFTRWLQSGLAAADGAQKLAQRVGASTENLSALHLVARTSASSLDEVSNALAKQNRFIGEAARGQIRAVATMRDLGITMKDFEGKDAVEIFELIAQKIVALPSDIQRTQVAMDIFGRAGANLIPTMRALADEGLARVQERARDLGVLIDTHLAESARQMRDEFELLKAQSEGLGARMAAGLTGQVSQALQIITGDLKQTTGQWEDFGKGLGQVIKFVVAVVSSGFDIVANMLSGSLFAIQAASRAVWLLVRGRIREAKEYFKSANEAIAQQQEELFDRLHGRWALVFQTPPEPTKTTGTPTGELPEDPAELAAKRAQAMQASLDRELSLARSMAGLRRQADKQAYEEGLIDLRTYFDKRRAMAEEDYRRVDEAIAKKRELLAEMVDPAQRLREEQKIQQELDRAQAERDNALAQANYEERQQVRALAQERLNFEQSLLEAQGKRYQAALIGIDRQLEKLDLLLRKEGVGEEERLAALQRFRTQLEAGAGYEEALRQAQAALGSLQAARDAIDAQILAGIKSEFEGEQELLRIEQERLVGLRELAQALLLAAEATGDPDKIAQARAFAESIKEIGYAVDASKISFRAFATVAIDAGTEALTNFFDTGIEKAKSFGEAFRNMAAGIIGSLKRMAAELLAVAIMKRLAGVFGLSIGGEVGSEAPKKAGGGILRGIGTGTSDSNLAWFSAGEYVVPAHVVSQPGVFQHLEALRAEGARALISVPRISGMNAQRFAEGGLVDTAMPAEEGGIGGELLIRLQEGLILDTLKSKPGQRVIVKSFSDNRRGIKSVLGG